MMKITQITKGVRFDMSGSDSVEQALKDMRSVPEHELHFYMVLRDTLQATAQETRQIIAFAQFELDRRTASRTRWLAFSTTILSSLLALGGVALGAYLAAPISN